jgi:hypothetical protein
MIGIIVYIDYIKLESMIFERERLLIMRSVFIMDAACTVVYVYLVGHAGVDVVQVAVLNSA